LQPLPPFLLSHEPLEIENSFVLAGHWHPSFRLRDPMGSGLRLPCFYFSQRIAVLPAFGNFTGTFTVRKTPGDRIFLTHPEAVVELTGKNKSHL